MTSANPDHSTPFGLQANVIGFAIRFRGIVVAMALVLLGYGVLSVAGANYDVFPEFAPPQVGIQTEAPGAYARTDRGPRHPADRECHQWCPRRAIVAVHLDPGLSVITVIFAPGSDIYRDRQVVAERLAVAAQQLPAGRGRRE